MVWVLRWPLASSGCPGASAPGADTAPVAVPAANAIADRRRPRAGRRRGPEQAAGTRTGRFYLYKRGEKRIGSLDGPRT
jgi:hypothetical protein